MEKLRKGTKAVGFSIVSGGVTDGLVVKPQRANKNRRVRNLNEKGAVEEAGIGLGGGDTKGKTPEKKKEKIIPAKVISNF